MLDMFRHPEKILEACESLLPLITESVLAAARRAGDHRVFIPLHRGADGFMSLEQFKIFYWPTLKRLIVTLVDEGLTPCPFFEGKYAGRLEHLLELPRGKVLGHFDATDLSLVKEVLGGHLCIRGNVPSSLLCLGTPDDVTAHCRRLIDIAGKGGGFILSPRSSIDEARPENVKAMIDSAKLYGAYEC
jgi:uroporphyrinogen-III decarboxylase